MHPKITPEHLGRGAVVYIRQSTIGQVAEHTESQRRQYALDDSARAYGFASVTVIDDDLGRSGSGLVERPGFQKLVASVCSGSAGAVFCIEASRLARNGRDWHHLIDLCALVGTLVIDPDGTYDPRLVNDRLLLGLKGTMSEYELSLLRQRGIASRDSKALRGELSSGFRPAIAGTRSARSRWTLTSASAALSGCCSTNFRSSAAPGRFCFGHRIKRCSYRSAGPITAPPARSNGGRQPTIQCSRSKQRITHILIREVVLDRDDTTNEAKVTIHWNGGRHTELRVSRVRTGRYPADRHPSPVTAIRKLGGQLPDRELAVTLNRMRCKPVDGKAWTTVRVRELRERLGIDFRSGAPASRDDQRRRHRGTARHLHRLGPQANP